MSVDPEVGVLLAVALLALGALAVLATVGAIVHWVVPFVTANAAWIGLALAAIAVVVLLTDARGRGSSRPSRCACSSRRVALAGARMVRSRRVFGAVVAAIAEGRIDREHGVVVFSD